MLLNVLFSAFLSYKISNEMDVDVLGGRYKIEACGMDEAGFDQVNCLLFCKYYNLLRCVRAGNIMGAVIHCNVC